MESSLSFDMIQRTTVLPQQSLNTEREGSVFFYAYIYEYPMRISNFLHIFLVLYTPVTLIYLHYIAVLTISKTIYGYTLFYSIKFKIMLLLYVFNF